jgi:hypothetical protein
VTSCGCGPGAWCRVCRPDAGKSFDPPRVQPRPRKPPPWRQEYRIAVTPARLEEAAWRLGRWSDRPRKEARGMVAFLLGIFLETEAT